MDPYTDVRGQCCGRGRCRMPRNASACGSSGYTRPFRTDMMNDLWQGWESMEGWASIPPVEAYTQPGQPYMQPDQSYMRPSQSSMQPGQSYTQPSQPSMQPNESYAQPDQSYTQPGGSSMQPGQSYTQPVQSYMRPIQPGNGCCPSTAAGCLEQQYPTAMAYVPWQQWQATYGPERGLAQGTVFPEMDLPFIFGGCSR